MAKSITEFGYRNVLDSRIAGGFMTATIIQKQLQLLHNNFSIRQVTKINKGLNLLEKALKTIEEIIVEENDSRTITTKKRIKL